MFVPQTGQPVYLLKVGILLVPKMVDQFIPLNGQPDLSLKKATSLSLKMGNPFIPHKRQLVSPSK